MLKILPTAILMLLAVASSTSAGAAEPAIGCRLKGGSVVQLAAETCAMEGGTPITGTAPAASPAAPAVAPMPAAAIGPASRFSGDPKLAAAQKTVVELLDKPVVEKGPKKTNPEGVERAAQFDGCRLIVDESMRVDHGNLVSAKMNFKISSTVDFAKVSSDAFGVLGRISSLGGGLKAHAVYFEEPRRRNGNSIAISVLEQREEGYGKYVLPGPVAYWDAPHDDLWMADEYGYPKDNGMGNVATDRIRILFIVDGPDDAVALKKALDDVHALCKP